MNLIVTSSGATLESPVDPRFGRARHFLVIDRDSMTFVAHDNAQNLNAAQGAGIQAAQAVARLGGDVLITGHCGPKAFRVLKAAGIRVYTTRAATVKEAVERFAAGTLVEAKDADVESHW